MPIQDQLYYLAIGAFALLFDSNVGIIAVILIALVIAFVLMLCRMARRVGDD